MTNNIILLCVKTYVTDGGKGAGEQKTYLKFDWSNANEVKADDAKEAPKTDANAEAKADQKANDEIKINVNGKGLKPETPAYIENGRKMVSLRFISEALGEKVDWKAETKSCCHWR